MIDCICGDDDDDDDDDVDDANIEYFRLLSWLLCFSWCCCCLTRRPPSSLPIQVGKKTYTNGLVYVGELFEDQETEIVSCEREKMATLWL